MQKGEPKPKVMSIIEFNEKYGTEEQCKEHLFNMRFSGGFVCPKCGHTHGVKIKSRKLMQCSKCKYQLSATSGTIMDKTKTEIRKWYYAIYLMTVSKRNIFLSLCLISLLNLLSSLLRWGIIPLCIWDSHFI